MRVKSNHVQGAIIYRKMSRFEDVEGKGRTKMFGIRGCMKGRWLLRSKSENVMMLDSVTTSESFIDDLIGLLMNRRVPLEHAKDIVEDHMV